MWFSENHSFHLSSSVIDEELDELMRVAGCFFLLLFAIYGAKRCDVVVVHPALIRYKPTKIKRWSSLFCKTKNKATFFFFVCSPSCENTDGHSFSVIALDAGEA